MAIIIGLTGSIASGKSTVSAMFTALQIPVVDADVIARDVVEPGEKAYNEIVNIFGNHVLTEDKIINRKVLGDIIFSDQHKREQLNRIVHPAVREKMLAQRDAYVASGSLCVVLDIPLLFESKLTHFVDKTVVVFVDEDVQLERLMNRNGYSKKEAVQRIRSQMSVKEKAMLADAVIDNNGTKDETFKQLKQLLMDWHILND